MKSAHVYTKSTSKIEVRIQDVPVPTPLSNQVLIKVVVAGTNPKDWKTPIYFTGAQGENTGDDVAGYIEAVGDEVTEFKIGDRVAAFHEMTTPNGAFAEYAIAWEKTTFHLPKQASFEEAATIPLAAMTAALGLFCRLGLLEPWRTASQRHKVNEGVLVYGAASAVGGFAIKLLNWADVHPIIAVAGRGIPFVQNLLDSTKGDVIIDYRSGDEQVVDRLRSVLPAGHGLMYAFDAVSEGSSYKNIAQVLDPRGHVTFVLPGEYEGFPSTVNKTTTAVGVVHGKPLYGPDEDLGEFGYAWFRLFNLGLKSGWLTGHPYEVIPGGLGGVETGLQNLMDGKASAVKYVYRIAETEGLDPQ